MSNSDISSFNVTPIFHERIEPVMDMFGDDPAAFGNIMLALFKFSIDGEIVTLKDKYQNATLKQLRSMIELSQKSTHDYRVNQTINSNLKVAESEEDMEERLKKKGLSEDEIQMGVDRFRAKQEKDQGLNLTPDGQAKDWATIDKIRGGKY